MHASFMVTFVLFGSQILFLAAAKASENNEREKIQQTNEARQPSQSAKEFDAYYHEVITEGKLKDDIFLFISDKRMILHILKYILFMKKRGSTEQTLSQDLIDNIRQAIAASVFKDTDNQASAVKQMKSNNETTTNIKKFVSIVFNKLQSTNASLTDDEGLKRITNELIVALRNTMSEFAAMIAKTFKKMQV